LENNISKAYTDGQIQEIVARRRQGQEWDKLTKAFNKQYGTDKSVESLRTMYRRYQHLFEVGGEVADIKVLKEVARVKRNNSQKSKENRTVLEALNNQEDLLEQVKLAVGELSKKQFKKPKLAKSKKKTDMVMESMLSDLHIGKKTETFNLEIARQRLRGYIETFIGEYQRYAQHYNMTQLIIAMLGDMIENSVMHGAESLSGCEFQNPEQIRWAIILLFEEVLTPLAMTGVPIHVIGITGNHDRQERAKTYNLPGKNNLTWILYHSLKMLCDQAGYSWFTWDIPEASYTTYEIFGTLIGYEHGDNIKGRSKSAISTHIANRSAQVGRLIHGIRFGHVHEYSLLDEGRSISNSSLCGQDSYSDVNGYNSRPAQAINYYCRTDKRDHSFYHSFLATLD